MGYIFFNASDPEKQEKWSIEREGTKKESRCGRVCVSVLILREGKLGDRDFFSLFSTFGNNQKTKQNLDMLARKSLTSAIRCAGNIPIAVNEPIKVI